MEILHKYVNVSLKIRNTKRLLNVLNRHKQPVCYCSNEPQETTNAYPHLFIKPQIQEILRRITRVDYNKVFRPVQRKLSAPQYQFHTDEELQTLIEDAKIKALDKLQMPPVLNPRKPIDEVLSKDPEIQGYNESNHIFIDITPGIANQDRHIIVREPNGILRKAFWNERETMLNIYLPSPGREVVVPGMFQEEHLQSVLEKGWYEFILDHACNQFEPDDPEYIRVTQAVYRHVNKKRHFNSLRSTRHFGSMAFCLATQKNIDNLLLDMIEQEFLEDTTDLIKLHHIIHPDTESAKSAEEHKDVYALIMDFAKKDSKNRSYLELGIQALKELQEQRKTVNEGIKEAHGN